MLINLVPEFIRALAKQMSIVSMQPKHFSLQSMVESNVKERKGLKVLKNLERGLGHNKIFKLFMVLNDLKAVQIVKSM